MEISRIKISSHNAEMNWCVRRVCAAAAAVVVVANVFSLCLKCCYEMASKTSIMEITYHQCHTNANAHMHTHARMQTHITYIDAFNRRQN